MKRKNKHLKIISQEDYGAIYKPPGFSHEEMKFFFSLSSQENLYLDNIKTVKLKILFILQLGIFKKSKMFFPLNFKFYHSEINFIKSEYFPEYGRSDFTTILQASMLSQQQTILDLFHYRRCSKKERDKMELLSADLARVSSKPEYIFKKLKEALDNKNFIIPSYSFFQKVISVALSSERSRINRIIKSSVSEQLIDEITNILTGDDKESSLMFLMAIQKNFSLGQIKHECERLEILQKYESLAKSLIEKLEISHEAIKAYSNLIYYYKAHKLEKINKELRTFYFLCFVIHRTEIASDSLAESFMFHLNKINSEAKVDAKNKVFEIQKENKLSFNQIGKILNLFLDNSLNEVTFCQVKEKAFKILSEEEIKSLTDLFKEDSLDTKTYEWQFIESKAPLFKQYLRPIVSVLCFKSDKEYPEEIISKINEIKAILSEKKHLRLLKANLSFISPHTLKYVANGEAVIWDRYEFYVYKKLKELLDSGDIYIESSLKHRSFSKDLISDKLWANKKAIISESSILSINESPQDILNSLEAILEEKFQEINKEIQASRNPYLKIKKEKEGVSWHLASVEKKDGPKTDDLLMGTTPIGISDLLIFVDQHCGISDVFKHILPVKTLSQGSDRELVLASILSIGTNLGIYKMSQISNMAYKDLQATVQNYFTEDNLRMANDIVCNKTAALPVFKYLGHELDEIYSSSDGQKFETQHDTLKSRYSSKYFGVNKGISCCTLVSNHIPINAKVIGANEYEGHYIFDLLYNNTTDIHPVVHSTDGHGINQINFAILYFFGYQFAPRFKTFNSDKRYLYGFNPLAKYDGLTVKPKRRINKELVINEWPEIQKILLSLENKTVTQSTLVQKLCSYRRKNKTKDALWHLNDILESIFLLDYINDLVLRQNIEKSLNTGENYHKLKRAIALGNNGRLKGKTEYDYTLWSECSRLIANSTIYYNTLILNQILEIGGASEIPSIQKSSPISWEHINFIGRYDFKKKHLNFNIKKIAEKIMDSNRDKERAC